MTAILKPARAIVSADRYEDYELSTDLTNAERLRFAARALIVIFGLILAQHAIVPGVPRGSPSFMGYIAAYALTILASLAYLAATRIAGRPRVLRATRYAFVLSVMLIMSALGLLDAKSTGDQSAFFIAGLGFAVLFRCGTGRFAGIVLLAAAEFIAGLFLLGEAPTASLIIPFAISALLVVALAGALNRYDARDFVLNDEIRAANERLAADARSEETNARALRTALQERDELLVELQHRVKNNLNLVASIIGVKEMLLGSDPSARVLGDMRSRIQALASFYERLYLSSEIHSVDFAPYASDIIDTFVSTNAVDRERISVVRNFAPLRMRLQKAIALGLILNELFSSSIRRAIAGERQGRIILSMEGDGVFGRLRVEDDGARDPDDGEDERSFGRRLVSLFCSQIDAEAIDLEGPGNRTEIVFPIP